MHVERDADAIDRRSWRRPSGCGSMTPSLPVLGGEARIEVDEQSFLRELPDLLAVHLHCRPADCRRRSRACSTWKAFMPAAAGDRGVLPAMPTPAGGVLDDLHRLRLRRPTSRNASVRARPPTRQERPSRRKRHRSGRARNGVSKAPGIALLSSVARDFRHSHLSSRANALPFRPVARVLAAKDAICTGIHFLSGEAVECQ